MLVMFVVTTMSLAGFYDINPPPYDVMNFAVESPGDAGLAWHRQENEEKAQRHFKEVINARRTQARIYSKLQEREWRRRAKRLDKLNDNLSQSMQKVVQMKRMMRREGKGTFRGLK